MDGQRHLIIIQCKARMQAYGTVVRNDEDCESGKREHRIEQTSHHAIAETHHLRSKH